ncbi:MAG: EamA family transporter [Verrucomicrobia bacterium]|nr:EamA family transporter [Verrucomicrobiota bacterium]
MTTTAAPPPPALPQAPAPPRRPSALGALLLIGLTALFGAGSELCLKVGAVRATGAGPDWLPAWLGLGGLASGWVWGGIVFTLLAFLTYLRAVRFVPLGVVFALSNFVHVLIPLGAWGFLGESISGRRWLGIALVLAGLFVIARPYARVEGRL